MHDKKNSDVVKKWDDLGFLSDIKDENLKVKCANAYERACEILIKRNYQNSTDTYIFPILRRCLVGNSSEPNKLHDDFNFTDEKLIELIYICDNFLPLMNKSTELFDKSLIDSDAFLLKSLCEMYIIQENNLNKKYENRN